MTTYVRSSEAARLLGVTPATLYAYVSRGRITRRSAADGRASLFALEDVEELARRSRRPPTAPPPTIDVQITSHVTTLSEDGVRYRGLLLDALVDGHRFEDVAELIWSPQLDAAPSGIRWPTADPDDVRACAPIDEIDLTAVARIATAAAAFGKRHPADDAADAARRLLTVVPHVLGSRRTSGPFAGRVAAVWRTRPSAALVRAIDVALVCLADHELATSTLATRIAASVRTTPYGAIAAGLAAVEGALHGSASRLAHRFIAECHEDGTSEVVRRYRTERRTIPGFGHKVYRSVDPRCTVLLESVLPLDARGGRAHHVRTVIAEVGRSLPQPPNIDLALGALTWIAHLDPDIPLFAIARIAGWAAHYAEEIEQRPVRFRGLARSPDP